MYSRLSLMIQALYSSSVANGLCEEARRRLPMATSWGAASSPSGSGSSTSPRLTRRTTSIIFSHFVSEDDPTAVQAESVRNKLFTAGFLCAPQRRRKTVHTGVCVQPQADCTEYVCTVFFFSYFNSPWRGRGFLVVLSPVWGLYLSVLAPVCILSAGLARKQRTRSVCVQGTGSSVSGSVRGVTQDTAFVQYLFLSRVLCVSLSSSPLSGHLLAPVMFQPKLKLCRPATLLVRRGGGGGG